MTLVKYSSPVSAASPVDRLASEIFGRNIARFFGSDGFQEHSPRVNISESAELFVLELQVPGFDRKDLKVELVNDTLTVQGVYAEEEGKDTEQRWTRREFSRSAFERSFTLPRTVQGESIKAEHLNGVLRLTIPKREEAKPKMRQITIG